MKPAIRKAREGANCVEWPPGGGKARPAAIQCQAFMGQPPRRGPGRPSPRPSPSPSNSLAKSRENPPPGPTQESGRAGTRRTRRHGHPATPASAPPSGGPAPSNRRTGAANSRPATVAKPVAGQPSHTTAAARCIAASANTSVRSHGRNNVESGWGSTFRWNAGPGQPCARNSRGSKDRPARNAGRPTAGRPRESWTACGGVVKGW